MARTWANGTSGDSEAGAGPRKGRQEPREGAAPELGAGGFMPA